MGASRIETGETDHRHSDHLAELVLLNKLRMPLRAAIVAVTLIAAAGAALGLDALHRTYAAAEGRGEGINPIARILADGSTAATAWPGWAAAVFFAIAVFRLRRDAPEPPAGRGDADSMSVTELRAGLRAEYTSVRIALIIVLLLALVDVARLVTVTASTPSSMTLAATIAEALGLVAATSLLGMWGWTFRRELERWGAV